MTQPADPTVTPDPALAGATDPAPAPTPDPTPAPAPTPALEDLAQKVEAAQAKYAGLKATADNSMASAEIDQANAGSALDALHAAVDALVAAAQGEVPPAT